MQKSRLGAIQNHTEVSYWLMSGTEEDMAGLHPLCLLKRPRTSCYMCAQKPSDDRVLKSFCFPLVQLVIFQKNQTLGVLRMWVQVTQSWLNWPVTSTVQRAPHSEGTPPLLSLS